MLPAPSTLASEYDHVLRAAAAVGLGSSARRIARRASTLDQPFTLCVIGDRRTGKSSVINQLAGADIAPIGGQDGSWLNVYRRRAGRHSYAEVQWRAPGRKREVMPLEQAQSLTQGGVAFEATSSADIDRIVWHVDAKDLHRDLALVEVPDTTTSITEACWEADAILWVAAATSTGKEPESTTLPIMRREHNPFVPAMCVVTHMDRVARGKWISRLRTLRNTYGLTFENVVPFAVEHAANGHVTGTVSAPLRRAVFKWFLSGADHARRQNHQHFLAAMKRLITRRIEREVDELARSAAAYADFITNVDSRLRDEVAPLQKQVDQYLKLLTDAYCAYGERLERAVTAPPADEFVPPIQAGIFFARLTDDLNQIAREHAEEWTFGGRIQPIEDGESLQQQVTETPRLPAPPLECFEAFKLTPATSLSVEAALYDAAHQTISNHTTVEAAEFMPARAAVRRLVDPAQRAAKQWFTMAVPAIADAVIRTVRTRFLSRFGCFPEGITERLQSLDDHYVRLTGSEAFIPATHLDAGRLSCARFLWHARDRSFIAQWNRPLMHQIIPSLLPEIGRHLKDQLQAHRAAQQSAMQNVWPALRQECIAEAGGAIRRMLRAGSKRWSVRRVLERMPSELLEPSVAVPTSLGPDQANLARLHRLLLTHHDRFLCATQLLADGSPVRRGAVAFCQVVQEEITRVWTRPVGDVIVRDADDMPRIASRLLDERTERVSQFIDRLVSDRTYVRCFTDEVLASMQSREPVVPPYRELVQRARRTRPVAVAA